MIQHLFSGQKAESTLSTPTDFNLYFLRITDTHRILELSYSSHPLCNIMAEGFRFMPLGLVRLRTFRLSAWVS